MSDYAKMSEKALLLDYLFWDGAITQEQIDGVAQARFGWPTKEEQAEAQRQHASDIRLKAEAEAKPLEPPRYEMAPKPDGYVPTQEYAAAEAERKKHNKEAAEADAAAEAERRDPQARAARDAKEREEAQRKEREETQHKEREETQRRAAQPQAHIGAQR
jgi:hypothetical protein